MVIKMWLNFMVTKGFLGLHPEMGNLSPGLALQGQSLLPQVT